MSLYNISLTHWGRVTHICVSDLTSIGSDNGLSPGRRQAIIWTNAGILLIGPLGTNFSSVSMRIPKLVRCHSYIEIIMHFKVVLFLRYKLFFSWKYNWFCSIWWLWYAVWWLLDVKMIYWAYTYKYGFYHKNTTNTLFHRGIYRLCTVF